MDYRSNPTVEQRVLILAPTTGDGQITQDLLAEAGVVSRICEDLPELCRQLEAGAAALLLAEDVLDPAETAALADLLVRQPHWSDLPILLLTRNANESPQVVWAIQTLRNVILLEMPVHLQALVSLVRMALQARQRQYELRDYLAERERNEESLRHSQQRLQELNETLEHRVAERTAEAQQRAVQLQKLAGELTQAEERERRRLAQVLHDHLQQLLVGAKFHAGFLRNQLIDDSQTQSLQVVDDLLSQSIEASRNLTVELSPPILYEGRMWQVFDWLARWMNEKHRLTVRLDVDRQAEPQSQEIRVLIFQVVRELLFNVVKHARVSAASVALLREGEAAIRVVVEDQGAGFASARLSADLASKAGFGLFSVRQRILLMDGRFAIDSHPGQGTRVEIVLPVRLGTTEVEPPTEAVRGSVAATTPVARKEAGAAGRSNGSAIRVMLADDHEVVRNGLARLLQMYPDIEVAGQASDGQEAVDLARQVDPDVILMDISMPRLTGIEATRRIHEQQPHVQVIGLSMHAEADMAAQMRQAGAAAYLPKASSPAVLVETIRSLVGRPGPQRRKATADTGPGERENPPLSMLGSQPIPAKKTQVRRPS